MVKEKTTKKKTVKKESPVEVETITKPEPKKRKTIDKSAVVEIMNNTSGRVHYASKKTGAEWHFLEYGAIDEIEVSELITMKNAHPRYLKEPWLLILDEDVVEFLGLSSVYENVLTPDELEDFFKMRPQKVSEILSKMSTGMKEAVLDRARQKYEDRTLENVNVIRAIEDTLKVEIMTR